jgi:predicted enzyme related to lactoylglutathione lyase
VARVQLALNVADLDEAIAFYSKLFSTAPAKIRPGYANFAVEDPPLKLVLFEGAGEPGTLNHLGMVVDSTTQVVQAAARVTDDGLGLTEEMGTTCCFAVQDKVWVHGPDNDWEVYTVLADAPMDGPACDPASGCCA